MRTAVLHILDIYSRRVSLSIHAIMALVLMLIPSTEAHAAFSLDTWTARTSTTANSIRSVTNGGGTLVAVAGGGVVQSSLDGVTWTGRASGTLNQLNGVAYGNGTFVAVGAAGTIITSTDGSSWAAIGSGTAQDLNGVTYGAGIFVTVGNAGVILTSIDGLAWSSRVSGTGSALYSVTAGPDKFVAVGAGGAVLSSADGTLWTARVSGSVSNLLGVTYGNGTFIIGGAGGAILNSPNGTSWAAQASGTANNLNGATFGYGTFVLVGASGTILTSNNGLGWTSKTSGTANALNGIASGAGTFLAVGASGTILQTNPLGGGMPADSWTWRNPLPNGNASQSIAYGGGKYVAVGLSGVIETSPDGVTWSSRASGLTCNLFNVIYAGGQFVAVGDKGIVTSSNGDTWTVRSTDSNYLFSVTYGGGLYVAVGTTGAVATSSDGITWSKGSLGGTLIGVAYGGGTFVAVGANEAIYTSSNGTSWTSRDSGTGNTGVDRKLYYSVAYGNSKFVLVGQEGLMSSSSNGSSWSGESSGTDKFLSCITYVNSKFIAVGSSGTIITSPDGSSWTAATDSGTTSDIGSATYGGGKYVAVGNSGLKLNSGDAATWVNKTTGLSTHLYGVTYGNGTFVTGGQFEILMSSEDGGSTWTIRSFNPDFFGTHNFMATAYGGGTFAAVGTDGDISTSPNGITWTTRTSGSTKQLNAVAYGASKFVAVGGGGDIVYSNASGSSWSAASSGTTAVLNGVTYGGGTFVAVGLGGAVLTSPNGSAWTGRSLGSTRNLNGVGYGGGVFVAVGDGGAIFTSTDGASWTARTSGSAYPIYSVTYSAKTFLAVGAAGTVLTSPDGITWTGRFSGVASSLTDVTYAFDSFLAVGGYGTIIQSDPFSQFVITSSVGSGSGSISPVGTSPVTSGENKTYTITPSSTSTIVSVVVDGSNAGALASYTFASIGAGHTIVANFAADATAPITAASPSGGAFGSARSVTLSCVDGAGSGCATTYYCLGTGCTPNNVYGGAIPVAASTDFSFRSTDVAGNTEATNTVSFTIDTAAPTTLPSPVGGSYSSAQNVALNCSDTGGGTCATTKYCLGSGCTPTTVGTVASVASTNVLRFLSIDSFGNTETVNTASYMIDGVAPVTTASVASGTFGSARSVTLSCGDTGGGTCASTQYCLGAGCSPASPYAGAISVSSTDYLRYYSTDSVGNTEAVKEKYYVIDTLAPATTPSVPGGIYNTTQHVALGCLDSGGSTCSVTRYCLGAGCSPATSYSSAVTISSTSDLRYYSTDAVGNAETVGTVSYLIDTLAPVTTPSVLAGTYYTPQSVTLACNDTGGSGCASTTYCLGAGCSPSITYVGALGISDTTDLRVSSADAAGNIETVRTISYVFDIPALVVTSATPKGGSFSASQSVTLSCQDAAGESCVNTYYCLGAACAPATLYGGAITISGTTDLRFYSSSTSGHNEPIKTESYLFDTTAPVTTATSIGYVFGDTAAVGSLAVTLSSSDGSGVGVAAGYPVYCVDTANTCTPVTVYSTAFNVTCAPGNTCTQYVRYRAADKAGNTETVKSSTVVQAVPLTVPTGTVTINSGDIYTKSTSVTLTINATDNRGITGYYKSNVNQVPSPKIIGWAAVNYAGTFNVAVAHKLAGPAGVNTVYVWFRDADGNVSAAATDTIILDNAPPVNGSVGAVAADRQVTVSWDGFSDASSGLSSYKLAYAASGTAPSSCSTGTIISGVTSPYTVGSLTNNKMYAFRVCAVDAVGNISTGAVASARPMEHIAPTGSVLIQNGAQYTKPIGVMLTLSATDNDAVVAYYKSNVSNAPTSLTTWTAVPPTTNLNKTVAHTLATTSGLNSVYVWYKDRSGNVSDVATDSIYVDSGAPYNGVLTVRAGSGLSQLDWSGFGDPVSGVAGYKIAYAAGVTAPSSCSSAQFNTAGTSYTHTGLTMGATYAYRVCAVDMAGNASSGVTKSVTIKNDLVGSWALNRVIADVTPGGTWSAAQFAIGASGATACSSYKDGSGGASCSAFNSGGPIWLNPDGTMFINATATGGGAIKSTSNMMAWVKDDESAGLALMVLSKLGATYSISNTAGTWVAYGLNAAPDSAKWYGFIQDINASGVASCSGYGDSGGGADCSHWGVTNYAIAPNGILNGIAGGAGVMNAGKDVMTIVRASGGNELALLTKIGGAFAQADMAGIWMAYGLKASASAPVWYVLKQAIDVDGLASCVSYKDSEGGTDCSVWDGRTYLLGASGQLTNLASGGGVMNRGKDMMTWVFDDGAGGYDLIVLMKMP